MNLTGKKVKHNKFGEGVIIQQDGSYVSVKFAMETELKKFIYPSCFKTFLKLLDAETATLTDAAVKQHEEQERKKKQQDLDDAEARRFAKRMQESGQGYLRKLCIGKQKMSFLQKANEDAEKQERQVFLSLYRLPGLS